jgi:alginate O-acetyltransferase complex protein AlgI
MGRIFGFTFLENFNYPYISTSVSEFWRRWHISLGSFFREYVYIPLGGNRVSRSLQIFNLAVVWALTGLWHGASRNFIVWGISYGLLLIAEKQFLSSVLPKIPAFLRWAVTMVLVIFGWVIFYHESLGAGLTQIGAMLGIGASSLIDGPSLYYLKHHLGALLLGCAACIPWRTVAEKLSPKTVFPNPWGERATAAAVTVLLLISISFMVSGSYNPFLYFRF